MSDNPLNKRIAGHCPAWPTNDRLTDIESKAFLHYNAKHQPWVARANHHDHIDRYRTGTSDV
ncbi:hypothetical protein P0958_23560, partial [Xanthomonas hortorum pv. gardneri]